MTSLLSPCGDFECLKAAVYAGADEVYFGLSSFNARKNATNFDLEKATEAIRFCRLYGVKTNITLNTLLYEREYSEAIKLVEDLENSESPDSYIIQDIGLACALAKKFPNISLHASTQMQIHGSYSAEMLKEIGFTRAVLAREMTKDDIAEFVKTGMETEVFIHGAMCVCRSGACLMSSMIGKRSGNRGECAYPCRMSYNGKYPLSLKDMCLAEHIPELVEIGVSALKIEGRMKSPEYVYGVTEIYRRLLDENRPATPDEVKRLSELFSRSGFTDGYFTGKRKNMFGIRTDADKEITKNAEKFVIPERKIKISALFSGKEGENTALTLKCGGVSYTSNGFVPEKAENKPASVDDIKKQLMKTGGTPFEIESIGFSEFYPGFYPVSKLNELRRSCIEGLKNSIIQSNKPKRINKAFGFPDYQAQNKANHTLTVRFEGNKISSSVCESADRIVIPLWHTDEWQRLDKFSGKISLLLPGFIFDVDKEAIKSLLKKAKEYGIKSLTIPNASFLPICEGFEVYGGYELNVISRHTAESLYAMGIKEICASPEAKAANWDNASVVVYGRVQLMNTRNCLICNYTKCTEGRGSVLRDRTNTDFPIFCGYAHSNIIYNSLPIWLLDKTINASKVLIFTTESEEEQEKILKCNYNFAPPEGAFTRAYWK